MTMFTVVIVVAVTVSSVFLVQSRAVKNSPIGTCNELVRQMCAIVDRNTRPAVGTVQHVSHERWQLW
jgi:hypothetical protein